MRTISLSMFEFHGIKSNFEFVLGLWHFLNFSCIIITEYITLQNTDSNSISVYSENNAFFKYLYMINSTK